MRIFKKRQNNRQGATTVEFAFVAPIFFLFIFACIEFSRFWTVESYVESAVFQTARHMSVFGARIDEARPFAAQRLGVVGISEFTINVEPFEGILPQAEINDGTTRIMITISVPASEISIVKNGILVDTPIVRQAESITNRPN